ncbi:uncharacterized protein LOC111692425 [Anoplophora glabripennis]|uniref:uncharacterized protein LOC111692425 n=1 Tax=Anoplophora glabripennis TaxID=217634 RepID=UPI000C75BBD9|nr:uncharacterized protein LOC111692425 [Anoplophora glabripennis]
MLDAETFTLLSRKGVFPYDYIDCEEKLNETELPGIDKFYNKINDSNISNDDYELAKRVWAKFNISTLGQYSDLYMKTDILLLADVFEHFRQKCLNIYQLDPANYYTLPGYTWDCMLKYTKIELDYLKDVDMLLFMDRGIRGGVSQCCNRYAEANNKFMSSYDYSKPSKYLMYFDVNNLYGWAMSQYLPYGGFEWVDPNIDVTMVSDTSSEGYILEVDLEYPEHLHDEHKDLPLCPEHLTPPNSKLPKLMTTLYPKSRYIIHYRNLKQALSLGVKLIKIHRVLKFKQADWLKAYIELNTKLRAQSTNEFEKNLYKLLINAIFGKTMENIRKHRIIKLKNHWDGQWGAKHFIASPNFHSSKIFGEDLVAIELNKSEICFNKPLYVGMCILDISKTCVYDFHYNFMLSKLGDECKLLYTDTDSLIYQVTCDNVYDLLIQNLHKFDTSDYEPNNKYNIPLVNKKVPGLMKDECCGAIMTHFVGLRSKMYSILIDGKSTIKKSKGVKKNIVKNSITFDDYKNCLDNKTELYRKQRTIQSTLHNVFSVEQTKLALSAADDKRFLLNDTHDTLPWGHYSIDSML